MSERGWLGVILLAYLLVTLAYSVVNPLFEAPDEHWHYFTAQYIADRGKLPAVTEPVDEWLSQEAAQPPLYYWLGSGLIRLVDTGNPRQQVWLNPFFPTAVGNAAVLANKNRVVHTEVEAWPWQGYALAAHLLRGVSALLGLGTLLCVFGSGRLLWPNQPRRALLAAGVVAFLPQFNFVQASITNDVLITLLASLALWQLLGLWRTTITWQRLLLLGLTVGLAALTKAAGLLLLLYVAGALLVMVGREGRYRLLPQIVLYIIVPVLLLAGWLWWRNWLLYGDITATNQFVRLAGGDREYTLWQALAEMPGLWLSLFAVFGWFNVRPPEWVYWLWQGVVVLGIMGVLWQRRDEGRGAKGEERSSALRPSPFILLGGWTVLVFVGLVAFMLRTPAAQGRLLFPAIVPLALGLAYGLSRWRWLTWLMPGLALVTTLYVLAAVIPPVYARPPVVSALPEGAARLDMSIGQGVTLVGAQMETAAAVSGAPVWMTLYWRADGVLAEPPEMVLELFGQDWTRPIGKLQGYHGRGLYPANLWPPEQIVADRIGVRLVRGLDAPVLAQALVQLVGSIEQPAALVGEVKVAPLNWPEPAGEALAMVGEGVALTAAFLPSDTARPDDIVTVMTEWQVLTPPGGDFTAFVHLGEAGQPPLATGDSPPLNGRYPTRVWAVGEVIRDMYSLVVPKKLGAGRYPIWLGMYDPASGVRLPLTVAGEDQPYQAYLVGWVTVIR
jgi:4-amino-4-deoxy-L-arabinose transferase-like glycosyltransferase